MFKSLSHLNRLNGELGNISSGCKRGADSLDSTEWKWLVGTGLVGLYEGLVVEYEGLVRAYEGPIGPLDFGGAPKM
jgi:hypothetical protein